MKNYITLTIILFSSFHLVSFAQAKSPINFLYEYSKKNDFDSIKLTVENLLSDKTFYYSISVAGLTDTGWTVLNSDINSLGQNDFLALKPLKPKSKAIKYVSKKRILLIYAYYKPKTIRFGIMYYQKKDFESKGGIIYSTPM